MFLFLVMLCLKMSYIASLDCYQCKDLQDPAGCLELTVCPSDSLCAMDVSTVGGQSMYNMSCKPTQDCPSTSVLSTTFAPAPVVGRRRRATDGKQCTECCSRNACNKLLCSGSAQTGNGQCVDDPSFDCARVSTFYQVCADVAHAKQVCRRFCSLCDLVDGAWSGWSAWSACDVTCDNGTISRTRSCTNPAPAHGGSDCNGTSRQDSDCQLQACPVHGGWSGWSTWNQCSATCGIGLQTRRRTCSSPRPALFGDNCYGDSLEDKACFLRACADGSWSGWGSWGACSATCNGGIQHRTRSCNNPVPSSFGKSCSGDYRDFQACHHEICPGIWYNTPTVVFKARNAADMSPTAGEIIRYTTTVVNIGGAYSNSTGRFTAPYNGLYTFTVHICTHPSKDFIVQIMAVGKTIGMANSFDTKGNTCSSGDGMTELNAGDQVWVQCNSAASSDVIYQSSLYWPSFGGALIHRTI